MTHDFPSQDLDCPDPDGCPVEDVRLSDLAETGELTLAAFPAGRPWARVYDSQDGHTQPNPGFGDTRFAPFDALADGHRVPTLYLAENLESALLETSLHSVAVQHPRVIDEMALLGKIHASVTPPHELKLVDLRDPSLAELHLSRGHISSSSPEHYPCTRRVARAVHAMECEPQGIVWHSRQAELTGTGAQEVAVIFADRVSTARGSWVLDSGRSAAGSLLEGAGRLLLDDLADALEVVIESSNALDS